MNPLLFSSPNQKAYAYAAGAILFWSTAASAFKLALRHLHLIPVLAIATTVSLCIFFMFMVWSRRLHLLRKLSLRDYGRAALLGLLNPFAYYLILFKAYSLLPAQIAQPLNFIWPITLVLFSAVFFQRRLRWISIVSLTVSFVGVYFIASEGNLFNRHMADTTGVLLALGSSVFWALYWVLNMKDHKDTVVKLFLNFMFATAYVLILTGITLPYVLSVKGMMYAAYIGCFEMGITFVIWLQSLQIADKPEKISNMIYLTPFFSLTFIHMVLGERIYYTTFIGLLLIISSIIFQQKLENN